MLREKPVLDRSLCVFCGDCIQSCPTDAWEPARKGYSVFAGGMMGRHPRLGVKIADYVDEKTGMRIIQRCLDFYLQRANKRERFSDLICRVGIDEFKAIVLQE
ncbi:Nitrite and sulphite reductase 4Fe-4S domain protein [uncultured archaeon]|nr:Nitrite and sulphite reductase 4Fe-4S domain protein [uncultured archaeon]